MEEINISASGLADESVFSDEENIFIKAICKYKTENRRPFPSWREVLAVYKSLGYRKTEAPVELPKPVTRSGNKGRLGTERL